IGDMLLAICYFDKIAIGDMQFLGAEPEAQLAQACIQSMTPGVLAKHEFGIGPSDGLGCHDLVSEWVFEHAILVDAGFMGEGVCPDDGFIGLHRYTGEPAYQLACGEQFLRVDACIGVAKAIGPCAQRHYDFFHGGIACTLTQAIDGYFDLARTSFDGGQRVGRSHAEIIVAVGAHDDILHAWDTLSQVTEEHFILVRQGVADGIRHIDSGCTRLDSDLEDAAEIVPIAARGIFCRKLDGWTEVARIGYHRTHSLERLFAIDLQLVFEMNLRCCKKDVDYRPLSVTKGFPGGIDITDAGTGKPG